MNSDGIVCLPPVTPKETEHLLQMFHNYSFQVKYKGYTHLLFLMLLFLHSLSPVSHYPLLQSGFKPHRNSLVTIDWRRWRLKAKGTLGGPYIEPN